MALEDICGIILADGFDTRLNPITLDTSRQLVPAYDKLMTYYPMSTLMLTGIKNILVVTTPEDTPGFHRLLSDGSRYSVSLEFAVQHESNDLAQALATDTDFVGDVPAGFILGDNIFYGPGMGTRLRCRVDSDGGIIFAYHVLDPWSCGVIEFDEDLAAVSIEEEPAEPKSNFVVPDLYPYDNNVVRITRELKPSARGEYEITDVNRVYLEAGKLQIKVLSRRTTWLDTGTFDSLADAVGFAHTVKARQGPKIGAPKEVT